MGGSRIPEELTMVDAAWLSEVLGVDVVEVAAGGAIGGIAMTSYVARLRLVSRPSGAAPAAVVVKVANPQSTFGAELHEREVRFYRDFAAGRELPVPKCYFADFDPATGASALGCRRRHRCEAFQRRIPSDATGGRSQCSSR